MSCAVTVSVEGNSILVSAGTCSVTVSTSTPSEVLVASTLTINNGEVNSLASLGAGVSLVGSPPKTLAVLNLKGLLDSSTVTWAAVGNDAQATAVGGAIAPAAHASTHELSGGDQLSVAGLSGLLGDAQTPLAHVSTHANGGADELSVAGLSGLLADGQTPLAHVSTHANGGADELSVAGLSGLLADAQTPLSHSGTHENGGSDELDLTGLSGLLATAQTPTAHAATHDAGSTDVITDLGPVTFSGVIDWTSATVLNGLTDGVLSMTDAAGTGFQRIVLGPATSGHPAIKRGGTEIVHLRKGDDSNWVSLIGANLIATGILQAGASADIEWSTRSAMTSSADGLIRMTNAAGDGFTRLMLGPETAEYFSLKPDTGADYLALRAGDDTGWQDFKVGGLYATNIIETEQGGTYRAENRFRIDFPADGQIRFRDWNAFGFNLLNLGPNSTSFPALGHTGAALTARLGDDSGYTNVRGSDPVVAADFTTKSYVDGLIDQDEARTLYVGKHGNDSNDGLNIADAYLTIGAAITAAAALTPTQASPVVIRIQDAGVYTEAISVPQYVSVHAPNAKITDSTAAGIGSATVVMDADSVVVFQEIEQTSSTVLSAAVFRSNTAGTSVVVADRIVLSNQTIGLFNGSVTDGVLIAHVNSIWVDTGWGVGDASSAQGHTHIQIEDIYLQGNGSTGISRFGAGQTVGRVTHITEVGTPTTTLGLFANAGSLDLKVEAIAADTAWNVAVGGTLTLFANTVSGTRTEAGTVSVTEAGVTNPHQASHAGAGSDSITSLGAHDVTGNLTFTTDGLLRWGSTATDPMLKRNGIQLDHRLADDSGYAYSAIGHVGLGSAPTTSHLLFASELFTGTLARNGQGVFPTYQPSSPAANILYGIQGNCFFGTSNWTAGSVVNALQFYPAPDYALGSTSFGSSQLNIVGITTGAVINVLTKTITAASLRGMVVGTLSHIFGGPGNVTAATGAAIEIATPSATTGTIGLQTGLIVNPQLYGTVNQGLWMAGSATGSDIVFGTGKNARALYDGSNLIVDPAFSGSGRVYIGPTGNQSMLLDNIEIDGDLNHDGTGVGFYGTAPAVKPTITGAKAGNVALTNLLTALAGLGLLTDSTT